eukprot:1887349-Rhodomonas_salina.1
MSVTWEQERGRGRKRERKRERRERHRQRDTRMDLELAQTGSLPRAHALTQQARESHRLSVLYSD